MTSVEYQAYLASPWWRHVRALCLSRADYACQDCGWRHPGTRPTRWLEVHHLTYRRLGDEYFQDLVVLCSHCHAARHGLEPEPYQPGVTYGLTRVGALLLDAILAIEHAHGVPAHA